MQEVFRVAYEQGDLETLRSIRAEGVKIKELHQAGEQYNYVRRKNRPEVIRFLLNWETKQDLNDITWCCFSFCENNNNDDSWALQLCLEAGGVVTNMGILNVIASNILGAIRVLIALGGNIDIKVNPSHAFPLSEIFNIYTLERVRSREMLDLVLPHIKYLTKGRLQEPFKGLVSNEVSKRGILALLGNSKLPKELFRYLYQFCFFKNVLN